MQHSAELPCMRWVVELSLYELSDIFIIFYEFYVKSEDKQIRQYIKLVKYLSRQTLKKRR